MIPGLGGRIVQARTAAGFKRAVLAARIGISRHSLIWIEDAKTKDPRVSIITHIAQACGVTTDWLVGLVDDPHPPQGGHDGQT